MGRSALLALLLAASLLAALVGAATGVRAEEEPATKPLLRVGTSGDYAPFSAASGEQGFTGLDVALARRFAEDEGYALRFVRFRWPELLGALAKDRFDVAWSGITVRPERSAAGRFSVPIAETGAVALVPAETWTDVEDLDRPRLRIGVNAGGHLERVTNARFPNATRVAIPNNDAVLEALREGTVQAVVTDSAEAPHWIERAPELSLVALGPFTLDRKAALVHPERRDLARALDAWLLARERDGSLAEMRAEHLGPGSSRRTALPLPALLAAVDERLSLMPLVAVVKRESGIPLEVPEREDAVLDAAATSVLEAASRADRVPPPFTLIRAFFRAQMEAAKQVQIEAVRDPDGAPPAPWPDLDATLRPALLRIGDRIAALILELPPEDPAVPVSVQAEALLREPHLSRSSRRAIAEAITRLLPSPPARGAQPRTNARATSPAATGSTTHAP